MTTARIFGADDVFRTHYHDDFKSAADEWRQLHADHAMRPPVTGNATIGAGGRALGLKSLRAVGTLTALGPDGKPITETTL